MVFRPEQNVCLGPPHSSWLVALSQADISFELLSLCLRGDGHATPEDHIDLSHLLIVVGRIGLAVFALLGLLGHLSCWWWHLLMIQKSFALF